MDDAVVWFSPQTCGSVLLPGAHTPAARVLGPDLLCVNGPDTSMQSH